ncbi:MAG: hypothetical protein HUJ51_03000 [Eggerthellaceae bacterium]|nr:hypothetical protein [Eggerthellaceae bacterium]
MYLARETTTLSRFLVEFPAGVAKFDNEGEILASYNNLASVVLEDDYILHIVSSSRGITAEATQEQVGIDVEIARKYGFYFDIQILQWPGFQSVIQYSILLAIRSGRTFLATS